MNICIPRHLTEKLKNSALRGEVNIAELYKMSSAERRDLFTKHTDKELGKFINTEFEKAMISKQKSALTDWAMGVFNPIARQKPAFKNMLDKINSLDELGVLNPKTEKAFLEDLVADRLGVNISAEEVKAISEKAQKIDIAQEKLGADLGDIVSKPDENLEFFKAKKVMDDYLEGLNPAPKLRITTGVIGRGMMLFSIKSPILNIGSNTELGIVEALSRRLSGQGYRGADNKMARDFVKNANKIYQKTGYDISRMTSLADSGASGTRVLGDDRVHTQGKGALRKVGRGVEDIVFKQLMGAPDVAFASAHFADSVNLHARKLAKGDKQKAKEIMKDSMRLEPQTPEGEIVRDQGILDSQVATWTDKTWATRVSEGIRKILNDVSGDVRAGDFLLPFVKTPANVIATGMDYAGGGGVKALISTVKAIRSGDLKDEAYLRKLSRDMTRAGLGLTGAVVIANSLNEDDFIGAFDPARQQIEQLKNSNENSIRIGGKWVSADWLGPLSVPVTAMLYAKKYGGSPQEMAFQYGQGVLGAAADLPGVKDASDYTRSQLFKKDQSLEEMVGSSQDYWIKQAYSRLTPSIFSDVSKSMDDFERETDKDALNSIKAKIPGLRNSLPIKKDVFGNDVQGEPAWSDILFGSRVRTARDNDITKEVDRVSGANDKNVSFTDWGKSSSQSLVKFREAVGNDRFKEAQQEYGQELKMSLGDLFKSGDYQSLNDDEKLEVIQKRDSEVQKKIFKKYNFKLPRNKK